MASPDTVTPSAGAASLPPDSWNDTGRDVAWTTLTGLIEAQALTRPDATAVIHPGGRLTFAELDARANRLARLLIRRGAGPEGIVAVALPRSVDIVVAELAVLKAGAAFLPIDPDYPADRITFMLDDARPVLVITRPRSPRDCPVRTSSPWTTCPQWTRTGRQGSHRCPNTRRT
ncbi:AMP-binding protein [Lentzea tibetensis]|uniref:AMP-binding protein n=1 Tax=Lentzea tibetensis TaxID=2591470 RepID=UPI001F17CA86|nr:AMP-binding protein [Lentzea tibetensis]